MNLVDNPDGVQVVNTSVQTDFVPASHLSRPVDLTHGGRGVRSGNDISPTLDSSFDDLGVVDVRGRESSGVVGGNDLLKSCVFDTSRETVVALGESATNFSAVAQMQQTTVN